VEHSEGKDGESAMTILRFLCGSPHMCQLKTDRMLMFMGSVNQVACCQ
jgi:hypothetical protein